MKVKYCLPIIKNSKQQVLQALKTKGYEYYEVWLDYIKDLDDKFIIDIAKKNEKNLIFLFRRQNLEKIKLPLQQRQQIISLLSKFDVFVDVDFLTQYEELESIKKTSKIKLILSYHNYKETPKLNYLEITVNKMRRYAPKIIKISTFCQSEQDGLNLLHLLLDLKNQKLRYIVLGMGEKGFITRIFGTLWGNEITFAPKALAEKSAPGQLTKKQLEGIFSKIQ